MSPAALDAPFDPSPRAVMLCELLQTMGQELLALQHLSDDAQLVMSAALEHASLNASQWSRAQSLDLITQRLQGLVTFTSALSEALPPSWTIDPTVAVRDVSLGGLVNRLLRAEEPGEAPDPDELF